MGKISRVTLFKIPNAEDQQKLLGYYKAMPAKALKDGRPYIRSVTAGPAKPDQRSQGFTFAAISVFDSVEDMAYYDNGCVAHAELRTFVRTVHQGMMMVYLENGLE